MFNKKVIELEFELRSPVSKPRLSIVTYYLSSLSIILCWLTKITFLAIQMGKFSVQGFIFVGMLRRSMKYLVIYVEYHLYPGGAILILQWY